MKILYKKFKGLEIAYSDGTKGVVCGYTDDNLLIATKTHPSYSFRKFGKEDQYIEEGFKDIKYRYCYCLESTVIAQYPKKK